MIIRSSSAGNINHIAVQKENKPAEPQTPPVVGSGSPVRKSPESASQEDKKVNQLRPSKKKQQPKTTLEILMEDD